MTLRDESQIYPQSDCGATMDAVWNSLLSSFIGCLCDFR